MGMTCSYTMEASYGGTNLGSRAFTHFTTDDYEGMGRWEFMNLYYNSCVVRNINYGLLSIILIPNLYLIGTSVKHFRIIKIRVRWMNNWEQKSYLDWSKKDPIPTIQPMLPCQIIAGTISLNEYHVTICIARNTTTWTP